MIMFFIYQPSNHPHFRYINFTLAHFLTRRQIGLTALAAPAGARITVASPLSGLRPELSI